MLNVGLTGNVASGKSTVARHFERAGATLLDADQLVREVQRAGSPVLAAIADRFGSEVVRVDGTQIPPSGGRSPDAYGLPDWSDGWTYQVDPPAVRLHGGAIPAPDAQVEIVYLPEGYPQP